MKRRFWDAVEVELLRAAYPGTRTAVIAAALGRPLNTVYAKASSLGLEKTAEYMASADACRLRRGDNISVKTQFQRGHVPANKGLRRPGYAPGRMRETQFKKGQFPPNKDPEYYVLGALRINTDGYLDMRTSFAPGSSGWTAMHRILWEDANGPVPARHHLYFKDGDRLNVELDNIGLRSCAESMRLNSIHNLPAPLKAAIQLLGQLKRRIREKQDRGSAQPFVRHPRGPA
jgi:hypothetical protein